AILRSRLRPITKTCIAALCIMTKAGTAAPRLKDLLSCRIALLSNYSLAFLKLLLLMPGKAAARWASLKKLPLHLKMKKLPGSALSKIFRLNSKNRNIMITVAVLHCPDLLTAIHIRFLQETAPMNLKCVLPEKPIYKLQKQVAAF